MSEYISKQSLLDKTVNKNHAWLYTTNAEGKNLKEIVDELPSADVRPNIHGHWELNERGIWNCPKCGTEVYDGDRDKFCRVCGADFKYTPHEQMMREPIGEKGTE